MAATAATVVMVAMFVVRSGYIRGMEYCVHPASQSLYTVSAAALNRAGDLSIGFVRMPVFVDGTLV